MHSSDKFLVSKKGIRLLCDVLSYASLGAATLLAPFLASAAPSSIGTGISIWWLLLPLGVALATQVGSRTITYSLEKSKPTHDWSICGALHLFHLRSFGNKAGCRVTLFQIDHATDDLIPTHRFSAGRGPEFVERGDVFSKARFRAGRAIVGFSRELHEELIASTVTDGASYDDWAKTELQMTDEDLELLSKRNRKQKYFAAWGFLDSHGRFLGAIAVDSKDQDPYRDDIQEPSSIYQDTACQLVFLLTT